MTSCTLSLRDHEKELSESLLVHSKLPTWLHNGALMPLSKLDQWHYPEMVETSGGGLVIEEGYEKKKKTGVLPAFLSSPWFP